MIDGRACMMLNAMPRDGSHLRRQHRFDLIPGLDALDDREREIDSAWIVHRFTRCPNLNELIQERPEKLTVGISNSLHQHDKPDIGIRMVWCEPW